MWCLLYLKLQEAMRKAEAAGTTNCPVKIKLVAPPLYVLTTQTLDKVGIFSSLFS
jgi:translation initiation factor 2 subunit 1